MIKHVVFFKFKPEAGPAERRAVIKQLRALPDKIDVIRSFEIGEDMMHSARAWDVVEIATYDDLEALENTPCTRITLKSSCSSVKSVMQ
jgi:hypothetical protein